MNQQIRWTIVSVLLLCAIVVGFHNLAAQQLPPQRDSLDFLKHALGEAGAPPLTSQQEDQLRSLISDFQSAHPAPGPDPTFLAAHRAYEDAILNGDSSKAQAQADAIADAMSNKMRTRLEAEASFMIRALNVLKTNDQIAALVKQQGNAGVFRLLNSLIRGAEGPVVTFGGHGPFGKGRLH